MERIIKHENTIIKDNLCALRRQQDEISGALYFAERRLRRNPGAHVQREACERFVLRFLGDETFPALEKAMAKENYQDAFHIAHNLKGVASNLGFTKLHKVADGLTEALRDGKKPEDDTLLLQVKEEYERTIAALKKFQGAEQQP